MNKAKIMDMTFKTIPCEMKENMGDEERIAWLLGRLKLLYDVNAAGCYKELVLPEYMHEKLSFSLKHTEILGEWVVRGETKEEEYEYCFYQSGRIKEYTFNSYELIDGDETNRKLFFYEKISFDANERMVSWEYIDTRKEDGLGGVVYKGEYDAYGDTICEEHLRDY